MANKNKKSTDKPLQSWQEVKGLDRNRNKDSIAHKIGLVIFIIIASLIIIPTSIFIVNNSYTLARILPVSKDTKTRAFWRSLDSDKLEKLKKEGKIVAYSFSDSDTVAVFSDGCAFNFMFNNNGGLNSFPMIEIYSGEKRVVTYPPSQIDLDNLEDNSGILSKAEVEELAKKGIELYNQFVDDYNNL